MREILQIVICDDEKNVRRALRAIIERDLLLMGQPFRITEFDSGEQLTGSVKHSDYDIVFLDIGLNGLNGIETARLLRRSNQKAIIIFVTAFPDYVFQGYEVKALNYILKPYQDKKIVELLRLALAELNTAGPHYFTVTHRAGNTRLDLRETLYFFSDKRNITAVTRASAITFYEKLAGLQEQLPDFFIRIHNRYLANLNYITDITAASALCAGHPLPVSRQYRQPLLVAFARFMLR